MTTTKLLIVDDEEELRELLGALLADIAGEIMYAKNGQEAIDLLTKESFDAVLSDQKMPMKTGIEVLEWLRGQGKQTPFVMHTGFDEPDVKDKAKKLGAYAYIQKPWDVKFLSKTVREAVELGSKK